jgi:hypothetical protein
MSLNKNKLAICLGLLSGIAAPFVTGSVSSIASFPDAQFQARKQYSVAASAAASGQSLEQQYTQFLLYCRANIRQDCDQRRSDPDRSSFWLFSGCPSDAQAEIGCMRAWADLPPSDSFLAHANALMMAVPTLFSTARDFVAFLALAYAATMLWFPFIRWLKT